MPIRVLHIELGRHLYGGALQVNYLLCGLKGRGEHVLVTPEGSALSEACAGTAARIHTIPFRGELSGSLVREVRDCIREEAPDIVHIHSRRGADTLGLFAARRSGIPVVLTRRVDSPEPRLLGLWKYRQCAKVIAISEGIADVLKRSGVRRDRLEIVRSAVDTDRYRPDPAARQRLIEAFDVPPEAPLVGMVAQLIPRKGHRVLWQAVPGILREHPGAVFLIFGQGALEGAIRRQLSVKGWGSSVHLAGFRDDLAALLPGLDVLVHPAFKEGLGVSLLQAAACELPLVASAVGGLREVVQHGENGFLIEPGDARALQDYTCRLLAQPGLRERLGREGRRYVERTFSLEQMVEGNWALYQEVLR